MSIVRVALRRQYVVIDQDAATDVTLSWEAKGLHVYLLSRPDDWKVSVQHLVKIGSAGRDKIYRMLNELIQRGYAARNVITGDKGKILDYEYVIYESPLPENQEQEPLTENTEVDLTKKTPRQMPLPENQEMVENDPLPDFPDTDLPYTENQESKYLTNTEYYSVLNSPRGKVPIPRASTASPLPPARNPNGTFAMHLDWRPNDRFDDMLRYAGLPDYPWQDELPEFVLYRLGQSETMSQGSWEHRFVQTLKRNAARREQSGNEPTPLPVDWEPDRDIVGALLASGLTRKFLDDALLTFTAFWRDAGNAHRSWNAKFIEHVRHQQATQPQSTHQSTYENLTDRSWAEGFVPGIKSQGALPHDST